MSQMKVVQCSYKLSVKRSKKKGNTVKRQVMIEDEIERKQYLLHGKRGGKELFAILKAMRREGSKGGSGV